MKALFNIELHSRDLELIKQIKKYFGCGVVYSRHSNQAAILSVTSLKDLTTFIIPHFEKYPLLTQKAADFILFKRVVEIMNNKDHLTLEGLHRIVNLRASLNLGLSDLQKASFPKYSPVERPIIQTTEISDPNWIAGFATGESCFLVSIYNSKTTIGQSVKLIFSISQHDRDKKLLELIGKYLVVGNVSKHSEKAFSLTITKFSDNLNIIIPFFKQYPIRGEKFFNFLDFCIVADLMNQGKHLTIEGLGEIHSIKSKMNRGRK